MSTKTKEMINQNDVFATNYDANEVESSKSIQPVIGYGVFKVIKVEAAADLDAKEQRRIKVVFAADGDIPAIVSKPYWLKNEVPVSSTGKTLYINAFGKTSYADSPKALEQYNWFSTEGLRPCKKGEDTLTADVRILRNEKKEHHLSIQEKVFEDLVNGDVGVFESVLKDRKAMLLVGIREVDGKTYTTVFPTIKPHWIKDADEAFTEILAKDAESQYPLAKEGEKFVVQPLAVYTGNEQAADQPTDELEF